MQCRPPPKNARPIRKLHENGCFIIPNPWDVGSARYLQGMGFKALASTSAGYALTLGLPDSAVNLEAMLAHLQRPVGRDRYSRQCGL